MYNMLRFHVQLDRFANDCCMQCREYVNKMCIRGVLCGFFFRTFVRSFDRSFARSFKCSPGVVIIIISDECCGAKTQRIERGYLLFKIRKGFLESIVKVFAIYYAIADNDNNNNDDNDDDVGNSKDDNVIGFHLLSLVNG